MVDEFCLIASDPDFAPCVQIRKELQKHHISASSINLLKKTTLQDHFKSLECAPFFSISFGHYNKKLNAV